MSHGQLSRMSILENGIKNLEENFEKLNIFVLSLEYFGCGKLQRKNFEFLWWFLGENSKQQLQWFLCKFKNNNQMNNQMNNLAKNWTVGSVWLFLFMLSF